MGSYSEIKSYIMEKLNEIEELSGKVYGYGITYPSGYPYAVVVFDDTTGEFKDTSKTQIEKNFRIRVYQEFSEGGFSIEDAENSMTELVEKIVNKFASDVSLGGNCAKSMPIVGSIKTDEGNLNVIFFDVRLATLNFVNR